ncbi:hypothetical protein COCVIDRAFT_84464, partial [Bipolaris victoriae FI3]
QPPPSQFFLNIHPISQTHPPNTRQSTTHASQSPLKNLTKPRTKKSKCTTRITRAST